jgi:hypothetical protein
LHSPKLESTVRRGSDISPDARPSLPPRRARRPGERTLIVQRRRKSSKRDWLFVVLLVGALGLSASMYLSYQNPSRDVVDPVAYDESQLDGEDEPNPFADTTLQPWTGQTGQTGQPVTGEPAAPAAAAPNKVESSISASSVLATELRSEPPGAEVSVGGAVVGTTPVRVARDGLAVEYTLRMAGYAPKSVQVGGQSPATIIVELLAIEPTPAAEAAAPAPNPSSPQDPLTR